MDKKNFLLQLFNPQGRDDISLRKLFVDYPHPNPDVQGTGIFNLELIKLSYMENFYQKQNEFLWFPREISLVEDKSQFETELSEKERRVFENILSFLSFLDSIQALNLVDLNLVSQAYEFKRALLVHAYIEGGIHTEAYQYILKSIFGENSKKINEVYYRFKEFPPLKERNEKIAKNYQELYEIIQKGVVNTTKEKYYISLLKNLVQDFFLESVIFYMGFNVFHIFAIRRNVLIGTNKVITLIRRDEQLHIGLFKNLINTFRIDYPEFFKEEVVYQIAEESALSDIKFYTEAINDDVLGITSKEIEYYIKNLTDRRLQYLGFKPIFGVKENPFREIELQVGWNSDENSSANSYVYKKESFFETGATEYKHLSNVDIQEQIENLDLSDLENF